MGLEQSKLVLPERLLAEICGVHRLLLFVAEYFGVLGYSGIIFFI